MAGLIADRRLCLDRSLARLVEESDPEAAFLLAAKGQEVPHDAVKRLELRLDNGRVVQGPAPEPAPADPPEGFEPTVIAAPFTARPRRRRAKE